MTFASSCLYCIAKTRGASGAGSRLTWGGRCVAGLIERQSPAVGGGGIRGRGPHGLAHDAPREPWVIGDQGIDRPPASPRRCLRAASSVNGTISSPRECASAMYAASTGHCGETQRYPLSWATGGPLALSELSVNHDSCALGSTCLATSRFGGQKLWMISREAARRWTRSPHSPCARNRRSDRNRGRSGWFLISMFACARVRRSRSSTRASVGMRTRRSSCRPSCLKLPSLPRMSTRQLAVRRRSAGRSALAIGRSVECRVMKDDRHIVAGQLHVELEHEAPLRGVAKRRHGVLTESRLAVDDRSAAVGLNVGRGDRGPSGEDRRQRDGDSSERCGDGAHVAPRSFPRRQIPDQGSAVSQPT